MAVFLFSPRLRLRQQRGIMPPGGARLGVGDSGAGCPCVRCSCRAVP